MTDTAFVYDYTPLIRTSDNYYPSYMPTIRAANPNSTFPIPIRADILLLFGYMPVYNSEPPEYDANKSYPVEGAPSFNDTDGKWYKTWTIIDFTEEELAARLQDAKDTQKADTLTVNMNDFKSPIDYTYNGTVYQISLESNQFKLLTIIKNVSESLQGSDTLLFNFLNDTTVSMTKADFTTMFDFINTAIYDFNKAYWDFNSQIDATTKIEDLPVTPETFKV